MGLAPGSSPRLRRSEEAGSPLPSSLCSFGLALLWIRNVWSLASPKTGFSPFICPTLPWSSTEGELMRDGELRSFLKLFCIKYGHACQSSADFGNPYTTPSKWHSLPSLKHHWERRCHRIPYTPFWNHSFCCAQWRRGARGHQPPEKSPMKSGRFLTSPLLPNRSHDPYLPTWLLGSRVLSSARPPRPVIACPLIIYEPEHRLPMGDLQSPWEDSSSLEPPTSCLLRSFGEPHSAEHYAH